MNNSLGRKIVNGYQSFTDSNAYKNKERTLIEEKSTNNKIIFFGTFKSCFDALNLQDGMTLSFHHHLRNGDFVMNMVSGEIYRRNIKNLHYAPSAIFPNNAVLSTLIENKNITSIDTNYLNGPVAETIGKGLLDGLLVMNSHGGRPRKIESGELPIDVAFIACSSVDKTGAGYGGEGPSAFGSIGYAIADLKYAKKVVLVTDHLVEQVKRVDIDNKYVDYVLYVDQIGDTEAIVSGTTKITSNPNNLAIAKSATDIINELGIIKEGFTLQAGAGGTSLAVVSYIKQIMETKNIKASFALGGITAYYVEMLNQGLIEKLYDVQCFDLEAVKSFANNPKHLMMDASKYANPYNNPLVNQLDIAILGATEIDTAFNVNVTTSSDGKIMGGSGGHCDIANGSKVTLIVTNLVKGNIPIVRKNVTTITTPGSDVDILVTDYGMAINPLRKDLLAKLKNSELPLVTIQQLETKARELTGRETERLPDGKVIGLVQYRDGTIIDSLYKIKEG